MKQGYPSYPMIKNGMLTEGPFVYFQKAYANTQWLQQHNLYKTVMKKEFIY